MTDAPDSTIKRPRSKPKSLPNIMQKQIALDFPIKRDVEHAGRDIHPDPDMSFFIEYLAAEPGATADVEEHGRLAGGKI